MVGFVLIAALGIAAQLYLAWKAHQYREQARQMLWLQRTDHDDSLRVPFLSSDELSLDADTTDPNFWRGFSMGQTWMAALLARGTGQTWHGLGVHEVYLGDCMEMMHRIAESTGTRITPVDQGNGYYDLEVSRAEEDR